MHTMSEIEAIKPTISLHQLQIVEEVVIGRTSEEDNQTLFINGSQAMQGWEKELMEISAGILCKAGGCFLEAGLGFGFSALRIASSPKTIQHTVVEKYPEVIAMFRKDHP